MADKPEKSIDDLMKETVDNTIQAAMKVMTKIQRDPKAVKNMQTLLKSIDRLNEIKKELEGG